MKDYWILSVPDYHCFASAIYYYRQAGIKAKYCECGCSTDYYAVFYTGKQTDKIKQVIRETKLKCDLGI